MLQSGQRLRVHLGKGGDNDTNRFLDRTATLNNTTGEIILKNETGETFAAYRYGTHNINESYSTCNVTILRTYE